VILRLRKPLEKRMPQPLWPPESKPGEVPPDKLHALLKLAYAEGGGSVPDDAADWWLSVSTDAEFDPGLMIVLVAMNGGEPVGLCHCWTSSFIKDLVVHPDWRRRGMAEALLNEACHRLRLRGNTAVFLKVQEDNERAQRLYRRMGFRPADG
jgi:ribosomal protein S18 acetylase RimI-like enzyme